MSSVGTSSKELDYLISAQPRTKEDFVDLSDKIVEYIIKRHQTKPLYPSFVEHLVRELAMPLRDVEVRKAASALTTLANEKQKEQKDKTSGKKKKGSAKPVLGAAKVSSKYVILSTRSNTLLLTFVAGWIRACMTSLWMISVRMQTTLCRSSVYHLIVVALLYISLPWLQEKHIQNSPAMLQRPSGVSIDTSRPYSEFSVHFS